MDLRTRYRPRGGILQGAEVRDIAISPPIEPHEQAMVVSEANLAVIMNEDPDWVRIRNASPSPVLFALIVVPRAAVNIATFPWVAILQTIKAELATEEGTRALLRGIAAFVARSS